MGSLIALRADVELRGCFIYTPLMLVALDGNPRIMSALLAFGAYIYASSIDGGQSVISSADFGTEMNIHLDYCPAEFTSPFDLVFNVVT